VFITISALFMTSTTEESYGFSSVLQCPMNFQAKGRYPIKSSSQKLKKSWSLNWPYYHFFHLLSPSLRKC